MRTHRVGTFTLGITLIFCGILFLVQMCVPTISYEIICRMWPVIFILLGLEILVGNFRDKEGTFIYDKMSIFLTFIVTGFAMILGFISQILIAGEHYIHISGNF
ncbi:MAG: DUF5668 domain-containing protein [Lachnospiraceae bacterium]|nr:DUF5668 domain-containing protein [Lachnospiraceae bacterium]